MDGLYQFAGAQFDPRSGVLTCNGRASTLRPRTAGVLDHLLRNAGQVATKDELLKAVWSDLVVTENSLAQCVKEIRRELGDESEAVLKTVHKRGYLLAAVVQRAGAAAVAPSKRLSLMVLPLVNLNGDPEHDYFAEGLTEDLTMDLGRMPEAFVIARGTALAFAGRDVDARTIGKELAVRYVVEGTVRRSADEIVVNLSVSETDDARQVWAERFVAPRARLLELQRSMAAKVAHMLHLDLFDAESRRIERSEGTDGVDAHDLAMRAFALKVRSVPGVSPEVKELVARALSLDPSCALAWIVKSECHIVELVTRTFDDWRGTCDAAERAARTALSLDAAHRTANCALGGALVLQGRLEEGLACLHRQVELIPNFANAHNWIGIASVLMGRGDLAAPCHETAIGLSPRDPRLSTWIRSLALAWLHQGDDARGLAAAERSVGVAKPWPRSYETLAMAYAVNGLMEEARAAVRVLLAQWPGYSIARHRAEMISTRPAFLRQRERLLAALSAAGLPQG